MLVTAAECTCFLSDQAEEKVNSYKDNSITEVGVLVGLCILPLVSGIWYILAFTWSVSEQK